jgi:hypothetical protein
MLGALGLIMLASCTSEFALLADERSSTALSLRKSCEQYTIRLPEVLAADSLMGVGMRLKSEKRYREAYCRLDYAAIFYRLALAKHSLEKIEAHNRELETSLNVARSKLDVYERMLGEYNAAGKK